MELLSKFIKAILVIAIATDRTTEARVDSEAKIYPSCYTDASEWSFDSDHGCKHPLYRGCRSSTYSHLCCGPDHYCCNNNLSCCRRNPWTVYEIVGMVTGISSWVCLLVVLCFCLGPRWVRIARNIFKRNRKINPHHNEAELKDFKQ